MDIAYKKKRGKKYTNTWLLILTYCRLFSPCCLNASILLAYIIAYLHFSIFPWYTQ